MQQTQEIDILAYPDYRAFLKQSFRRQELGGLRAIARQCGLKSPGTLSMIAAGKRNPSRATAEKLAETLGLEGRRASLFVALTQLPRARTDSERRQWQRRIDRLALHQDEKELSRIQVRALSQWHYTAICAMADSPHFRRDPEWIARKLGRGITPTDVRRALGDLLNLGLLVENDGRLVPCHRTLTTPEEVRDAAIRRYHENVLTLAQQALQLPADQREMNGLTLSVSEKQIPLLKERIRRFRHALNEEFGAAGEPDRVIQIGISLFPMTPSLREEQAC